MIYLSFLNLNDLCLLDNACVSYKVLSINDIIIYNNIYILTSLRHFLIISICQTWIGTLEWLRHGVYDWKKILIDVWSTLDHTGPDTVHNTSNFSVKINKIKHSILNISNIICDNILLLFNIDKNIHWL